MLSGELEIFVIVRYLSILAMLPFWPNGKVFGHFANAGILAEWLDKVFLGVLNLFAILFCGIPNLFVQMALRLGSVCLAVR